VWDWGRSGFVLYTHDKYPRSVLRIVFVLRKVFLRGILLWCDHGAVLEEHLFLCNWIHYRLGEAEVTFIMMSRDRNDVQENASISSPPSLYC
jgi:hypothetical protein